MINIAKLRQRMSELRLTEKQIADKTRVSGCILKLQGIIPFTLAEAEKVADVLRISDSEFGEYFFSQ